jgi:RHS repeat-associated protein
LQEGFTYDPEGQLASTTTAGDNAGTTSFAYDINGNRVSTTNPDGSTVTQVFDGSDPVQQTDTPVAGPATTNDYLYGADGIAELTASGGSGSSADYYGDDGLGSVTDLTDASGDVAAQYAYDAYGANLGASGSVQQPFGYLGNETDPTTTQATNISANLDDFNAREYDPSLGEFLSPDPVPGEAALPQSLSAYPYGADNPFLNADPLGTHWWNSVLNWLNGTVGPIHSVAGIVDTVAAGLAVASAFIPGLEEAAPIFAIIATAAASVQLTTGVILKAEGKESWAGLATDAIQLTLDGLGIYAASGSKVLGDAGKAESLLGDANSEAIQTGPLSGLPGNFIAGIWHDTAAGVLGFGSRTLFATSLGFGVIDGGIGLYRETK